jgi:serine/threonine protein kinase
MIISDKYEVGKIIGEGAYSQVRLATEISSGKRVAMKLFKNSNEEAKVNMHEAEILESLHHKNIIRIIEYNQDADIKKVNRTKKVSFIVSELAEKGSLYDYIKASKSMSESLSKHLFSQILEAMQYMHSEGIAHRDIKSENIFIAKDHRIKLGDFGFAIHAQTSQENVGSSYFMAPEICNGQLYNWMASDVFSLGVLLFFMVVGKYPFVKAADSDCRYKLIMLNKHELFWKTATRNKEMTKKLSPEFTEFVTLWLSLDPKERPTINEMLAMPWIAGKACCNKQSSEVCKCPAYRWTSPEDASAEMMKIESDIIDTSDEFFEYH